MLEFHLDLDCIFVWYEAMDHLRSLLKMDLFAQERERRINDSRGK